MKIKPFNTFNIAVIFQTKNAGAISKDAFHLQVQRQKQLPIGNKANHTVIIKAQKLYLALL